MADSVDTVPAMGEGNETADLVAENASLRDRLLRSLADAENTRRRSERLTQDARRYAVSDFARELLAVVDNLQRSIVAAERQGADSRADAALIEGVRATQRMLQHTLQQFGVQPVEALGTRFDPGLHEAIMETDDPRHAPGTVAGVAEEGYTIHDRLLRPARVVVAKGRPEQPAQDNTESPQNPQQARNR